MAEPLFVSQTKLEEWVDEGEVTFDDNLLTLLAHNASYLMSPAARVTEIIDGVDEQGLLNHTFTISDLEARDAEYFHDSIILGDTAYQCEPGFVGRQQTPASSPAPVAEPITLTEELPPPLPPPSRRPLSGRRPTAPPVTAAHEPAPQEKSETDMDLLTDFMLKNM